MHVRLLGNLDVVVDGKVGEVPGAGERALLALLALSAGRVVSTDRLVDALWGDRLPTNPANALQTRVSKLRRLLAALGADPGLVATVAPGYRLDVEPAQVDALQFEHGVAQARAAAERGDTDQAYRRYRDALALWRGTALVDFAEELWASAEALRLEELRLAALAERIELDLVAGRHADVVTELEALVADHPLRESLHRQLMLALYRSGRQADALAAYQRVRDTLDRDLGLEPSAELRELEAAILQQNPALAAPVRGAVGEPRRGNLPARVSSVVGRGDDVDAIIELITSERLVTITGPGGAGKTTLAVQAAARIVERFHDGVWFVDLTGATTAPDVAAVLAAALSLPSGDVGDSRADALVRQLAHRRCLLTFDNCEHVVDAAAALADRLLAGCPELRILATSREALAVAGEVQYALAPLPAPDAVELFAQRAAAVARGFTVEDANAAAVHDICARLDGMPLAIELAAARVKILSVDEIAARLDDRFRLLTSGSRTAQARHQTLRATVDWSYRLLNDAERTVLQRLSVFTGSWTIDAAEIVCAVDDVLDVVTRLVDRSLVVAEGGRFRILETIRQFAAERLAESGDADTVITRNAQRLLRLAEECEPRLRGAGQHDALQRLRDEHDDLRAVLTWCVDGGDVSLGQRLAGALAWFWFVGDHEEGRRFLGQLVSHTGNDAHARGRALQALSIVDRPGACVVHPHAGCAAAAEESVPLLDSRRAAESKILVAVEGIAGRDPAGALALLDEAQRELDGDRWGAALADFVRMEILARTQDTDEWRTVGERAAAGFAELGDPWGMSAVRAHMAHLLRELGRLDEAVAAFDDALVQSRAAGLPNTMQSAAGEAGIVRALLGDEAAAQDSLSEAAAIAQRYGFRAGAAMADMGLAVLARRRGDVDTARRLFARAVEAIEGMGSVGYYVYARSGFGFAAELAGDLDAAEQAHCDVLTIAENYSDPLARALGLEGMAGVAAARGDAAAAELLASAAQIRHDSGRPADPLTASDVARIAAKIEQPVRR